MKSIDAKLYKKLNLIIIKNKIYIYIYLNKFKKKNVFNYIDINIKYK